ncbi:MAG: DUF1570 domain-containing protein [Planctomycetota bacterium]
MRTFIVAVSCALMLCTSALANTYTIRSRHYEIVTDLPRNDVREISAHMDAVASEFADRLSSFPVRNSMRNRLFIFADQQGYLEHLAGLGIDARNTGGMFYVQQGQSGLCTWVAGRSRAQMYHVLQHEGFHQFVHARIGPQFPIWANEGLAEYFGQALLVDGGLRTGIAPASRINRLKHAIKQQEHLPFADIMRLSNRDWAARVTGGDARSGLMYDQAWSMVHFLVHANNGRYADAFETFIELMSRGVGVDQALEEAFGTTRLDIFELRWAEHVLEMEPDWHSTVAERLEFLGAGLVYLHEEGRRPDDIDALRIELQRVQFRLEFREHGNHRLYHALDDALFTLPPGGEKTVRRRTSEPTMRLRDNPEDPDRLPPAIEVTGGKTDVALLWTFGPDGAPLSEIVFH